MTKIFHFIRREVVQNIFIVCIILGLVALILTPLLKSGLYADDAQNSLINAYIKFHSITQWEYYLRIFVDGYLYEYGRFFPLVSLYYLPHIYLTTVISYKVYVIVMILINIALFGYLIGKLTHSKYMAFLVMLVVPLFFQMRFYFEPILSYGAIMQVVFLFTILSSLFFNGFLVNKRKKYLFASISMYILALLAYEITYLFFIFHFIISFHYRKKLLSAFKATAPFVVSTALVIGISLYFRHVAIIQPYHSLNISPIQYGVTFLKQVTGSLPLIYYATNTYYALHHSTTPLFCSAFKCFWEQLKLVDLLVAALFIMTGGMLLKKIRYNFNDKLLLLFGIALATVPGMIIAATVDYQKSLTFGVAYLPLYIQFFGISLIGLWLVGFFISKIKKRIIQKYMCALVLIFAALLLIINMQNNRQVVETFNREWYYPRLVLERALESGLIDHVPDHATILDQNIASWSNSVFFFQHAGKRVTIEHTDTYKKQDTENLYTIQYNATNEHEGSVFLAKVQRVALSGDASTISTLDVTDIKVFELSFENGPQAVLMSSPLSLSIKPSQKMPLNTLRLVPI